MSISGVSGIATSLPQPSLTQPTLTPAQAVQTSTPSQAVAAQQAPPTHHHHGGGGVPSTPNGINTVA
jgi:hypothetical protein